MDFWCKKYSPKTFGDILELDESIELDESPNICYFHKDITQSVYNFVKNIPVLNNYDHPHIAFIGPPSSGKYTQTMLILEHIFGSTIYNKSSKRIIINHDAPQDIIGSSCHYEFYTNHYQKYKPTIFKKIITSLGESKNIFNNDIPIYIVIKNLHLLNNEYMSSLKQLTEQFPETIRFIITSQRYLPPKLCGIFQQIRISTPSKHEIKDNIESILKVEKIDFIDTILTKLDKMIVSSLNINYKELITWIEEHTFTGSWKNIKNKDSIEINDIIKLIFSGYRLDNLLIIRDKMLDCLSFGKLDSLPHILLWNICKNKKISNEKKHKCITKISEIESRMKLNARNHIHLEAIVFTVFHILYSS